MSLFDLFAPYSPEQRGDLETYLQEHDGHAADNLFRGPEYYFIIKDKGLIIPRRTGLRVNQSPAPDLYYFVNSDFMLESNGVGDYNMSMVGAKKGVYDPNVALKDINWTIFGLKI